MTNLLEQAINCNDGDRASKMIQDALGIESDDVANYCFPKEWPANREQRARIIGGALSGLTNTSFVMGRVAAISAQSRRTLGAPLSPVDCRQAIL
jgi:hypothetical protein